MLLFHRRDRRPSVAADAVDNEFDGLVALSAFNGAAIGSFGCVAAALGGDALLSFIAGCGAAVCAGVWSARLIDPAGAPER